MDKYETWVHTSLRSLTFATAGQKTKRHESDQNVFLSDKEVQVPSEFPKVQTQQPHSRNGPIAGFERFVSGIFK